MRWYIPQHSNKIPTYALLGAEFGSDMIDSDAELESFGSLKRFIS